MCGIIGATATRDISGILLDGLFRLEYRGYDSAGIALVQPDSTLVRARCAGRVEDLHSCIAKAPLGGFTGIAHTRWATHGAVSEINAHPFVSGGLALVHNGIIENADQLKSELLGAGYSFESETDSETVVHLLHRELKRKKCHLAEAVRSVVGLLQGAFALAVISKQEPDRVVAFRLGSPLVIGMAASENFVASDAQALSGIAQQAVFLEENDLAEITPDTVCIKDRHNQVVVRPVVTLQADDNRSDLGQYQHYMQKEIFEQPASIKAVLDGRMAKDSVLDFAAGKNASGILDGVRAVSLVACGSSYLTACVAGYWLETYAKLPCHVEIASEYRHREPVVQAGNLFVAISQSGETADTLAAFNRAKERNYLATLSICNVPMSTLPRLSDIQMAMNAGVEIGVASTKAVSAQLVVLMLLVALLRRRNNPDADWEKRLVAALRRLPAQAAAALRLDADIERYAKTIADSEHALFVGRGSMYPIVLEGALKLKEISYMHAEGYAAGELKHGPLALVDEGMPVIALASNNALRDKLKSNLQEINARGGQLCVFADQDSAEGLKSICRNVIVLPDVCEELAPILYLLPLQLLAYHVALCRNTNLDKPRNLAKSVTVE